MSRSRRRANTMRRLARLSVLARVISGSATRRSVLALASVVLISSWRNSAEARFCMLALWWLLLWPRWLPWVPWRMVLLPSRCGAGLRRHLRRRPVLERHAEVQVVRAQRIADLGQRLLAQVRRLQQVGLGALHQVADVVDVLGLQAVGR